MRAEAWLLRRRTAQDDTRFVEICVARSTRRLSEAKWLYRQPLGFSRGLCFAMNDCDVKGGCVSRGGANSFEAESEQGQKRESDHIHGTECGDERVCWIDVEARHCSMFCVERWELPGTSRTRDERQRGAAVSVKNCILMWDVGDRDVIRPDIRSHKNKIKLYRRYTYDINNSYWLDFIAVRTPRHG